MLKDACADGKGRERMGEVGEPEDAQALAQGRAEHQVLKDACAGGRGRERMEK